VRVSDAELFLEEETYPNLQHVSIRTRGAFGLGWMTRAKALRDVRLTATTIILDDSLAAPHQLESLYLTSTELFATTGISRRTLTTITTIPLCDIRGGNGRPLSIFNFNSF